MGSRILIDLVAVLSNPRVSVELYSEPLFTQEEHEGTEDNPYLDKASLKFASTSLTWTMDYSVHDGKVTLEADFNYFRNPDQYSERMRLLFEHSIMFFVSP